MQKKCKNCSNDFSIDATDAAYYQKINVLHPTLCHHCRQQRRAVFRNERNLYHNTCSKTGAKIISMYKPESNVRVYGQNTWWSDAWNPLEYGREFNFNKPFFEQYHELQKVVPRLPLYSKNCENSDFSNHIDNTKNAYLCADVAFSENTLYSKWIIKCTDLVDCYQLEHSEQCIESLYSNYAHNSNYIYLADNCSDTDFMYNCKGVKNSVMCWNLRNKEFHIKNKHYTPEKYAAMLKEYDTGSYKHLKQYQQEFEKVKKQAIRKPLEQIQCEDCTGDYLYNCKNVHDSFSVIDSWDTRYSYDSGHLKDCYDVYESAFDCELQYECHACNRGKFLICCSISYDVNNCAYSEMCHNSNNLFGCIGLRHKEYCILNKQYSKQEYEIMYKKIIDHMKKTGEWGEFFPITMSFFAYNESAAPEFIPQTKEEIEKKGWHWYEPSRDYQKQSYIIPDHIKDVPENITQEMLACIDCGKNYKIIIQELALYKKKNMPIPRKCPNCRYLERLELRNPYKLYQRNCKKCKTKILTTYAPKCPEIVYCESCYLKSIY